MSPNPFLSPGREWGVKCPLHCHLLGTALVRCLLPDPSWLSPGGRRLYTSVPLWDVVLWVPPLLPPAPLPSCVQCCSHWPRAAPGQAAFHHSPGWQHVLLLLLRVLQMMALPLLLPTASLCIAVEKPPRSCPLPALVPWARVCSSSSQIFSPSTATGQRMDFPLVVALAEQRFTKLLSIC